MPSCLVAWVIFFLFFGFLVLPWCFLVFFWFFFGFLVLLSVLFISLLLGFCLRLGLSCCHGFLCFSCSCLVLPFMLFNASSFCLVVFVFAIGFPFFCVRFCVCLGPSLRALEQRGAYSGEPPGWAVFFLIFVFVSGLVG